MPKLRVHNFAVSLDGFAAGPHQTLEDPMGAGGQRLHEWAFKTRFGRQMIGLGEGGEEGLDCERMDLGVDGIGATIMGRNMFGPVRGEWPDKSWTGWWGDEPPFHHPVFVLTHHERRSFPMGETTFHFTDAPIEEVLATAFEAAAGADVRLGGGTSTVQQYLRAGLVDDLHLAVVPVLLGGGERLLDGLGQLDGYECVELATQGTVAHVHLAKRP